MCHRNTARSVSFFLIATTALLAQSPITEWRKVGNSAVDTGLASFSGGPVAQVWFSEDGGSLFARTTRGLTFVTADFETWSPASAGSIRAEPASLTPPARLPESTVSVRSASSGRIYSFGKHVYASDDGGRTWINITAYNNRSVIGEAQHDLAISPRDPALIAVANDSGVWSSHDGGLSWTGLNENLPNLPVNRLLARQEIAVAGIGIATLTRGMWAVRSSSIPGAAERESLSATLGVPITALEGKGDFWYAGSSDGRLWTSSDGRLHWALSPLQMAGPVERIFIDAEAPRIALLAAAAKGAHLFRTVNAGLTWDDITGSLSDAPAHGIAADRSGGAVYVATDRGVFLSRMDLNAIGVPSPWISLSANLPDAPAMDVRLNAAATQLTAALDGYGVYVAPAPHQAGTVRLVNAADLSQRAAAPGGLLSVLGANIESATAGGKSFPVLASSQVALASSQIQVPFGITGPQVTVSLARSSGNVTIALAIKPVSPAFFLDREGAPMLLDGSTGMMLDPNSPAPARSLIQVLATGLGQVKPEWPSGTPAPLENPPVVAADVHAFLNDAPVEVTRATLAPGYIGLYLVELRIPALLDAGTADLYLLAGGEASNHVRIQLTQ
ncbi:MAG: hypothetical protein M3Z09_05700 [Acidobacteriota bacterium]|nr:hypothetical protein [Acidobacteriota bacterium]